MSQSYSNPRSVAVTSMWLRTKEFAPSAPTTYRHRKVCVSASRPASNGRASTVAPPSSWATSTASQPRRTRALGSVATIALISRSRSGW